MTTPHPRRQLLEQLAHFPLFAGLQPGILEELAASALPRQYATGEVVFMEGEPPAGLLLLESGRLKVVKASAQGREHILEVLAPFQAANAVAVFTQHPNPAAGVALEPVRAWLLPRAAVVGLLRKHPAFAERIIENMADHMVRLVELVADLSLRSVMQRLAKLLLAEAVDDVVRRPRWFTQPELAARLGTVPDVLQRALGSLAAGGLVEVDRREIRILDRQGLRAVAE